MNTYSQTLKNIAGCLLALATLTAAGRLGGAEAEHQTSTSSSSTAKATTSAGAEVARVVPLPGTATSS